MRRCLQCLECGCKVQYVQMSPDVVLECQECGRGSADSCITTGNGFYYYSGHTEFSKKILSGFVYCRDIPWEHGHQI